jgi:predicted Zn-dependent protease
VSETPVESECKSISAAKVALPGRGRLAGRAWHAKLIGPSRSKVLYVVIGLAAFGCVACLAAPHLWAWRHFRAGRSELERFHSEQARVHFDACLRLWPASAEAHLLAARAARRFGDLKAARDHLRECQRIERTPSDESVFEWTLLRAASGDLDELEPHLLGRIQKDPTSAPLIWEALAQGCLNNYRLRAATNYLDDWLEQQPENVQALFLRGSIRQQARAASGAAEDFQRVVELDPERDDARRLLARNLLKIGRYDEAYSHLNYLHKRRPSDAELTVNMARCEIERGRRAQARASLDAVLADHPGNRAALVEHGRLALREGQPAEAEEWLRKAVAAGPNDYYANWQLYESLRLQGKMSEAEEQLGKALAIQDRAERLGEIQTRLMSINPHDPALHCEMGTLLIDAGFKELGENWLLSALYQDEHYGPAHAALADLYEERGETEQAAEQRRLAQAAPTRSSIPTKP